MQSVLSTSFVHERDEGMRLLAGKTAARLNDRKLDDNAMSGQELCVVNCGDSKPTPDRIKCSSRGIEDVIGSCLARPARLKARQEKAKLGMPARDTPPCAVWS
jgi:hypothetical protein